MSNFKRVSAIVTGIADKGEYDKTIRLFADGEGLINALAKGVRKPSAKLKFAAQPFNLGVYELEATRAGYIMTGCEQITGFHSLTRDVQCFYAASVALEIINSFPETEKLFDISVNYLYSLEEVSYPMPLTGYLLDFLEESGGGLSFHSCASCGKTSNLLLDVQSGGVLCISCADKGVPLPLVAQRIFLAAQNKEITTRDFDNLSVSHCLKLLSDYIEALYCPIMSLKNLLSL